MFVNQECSISLSIPVAHLQSKLLHNNQTLHCSRGIFIFHVADVFFSGCYLGILDRRCGCWYSWTGCISLAPFPGHSPLWFRRTVEPCVFRQVVEKKAGWFMLLFTVECGDLNQQWWRWERGSTRQSVNVSVQVCLHTYIHELLNLGKLCTKTAMRVKSRRQSSISFDFLQKWLRKLIHIPQIFPDFFTLRTQFFKLLLSSYVLM